MQTTRNTNNNNFLFALIPTCPSVFFGLIYLWQQGSSSEHLAFVSLMVLFSLVSSYFMWVWHTDELNQQKDYLQKRNSENLNKLMAYTVELERMLLMVEPKIVEQVLAAKEITEQETAMLIRRFSSMLEELKPIFDFTNQTDDGQESKNIAEIRDSAKKIRSEIDVVLESLQFQDRVSQILALAETNLVSVRETLENIQLQGTGRNQNMLKVEEMVANIQTQYEAVKRRNNRPSHKRVSDEITLF
jgi:hypothetical protein